MSLRSTARGSTSRHRLIWLFGALPATIWAVWPLRPVAAAEPEANVCTVERVYDGDTLTCGGERIRLLLIDAPEMRQKPYGVEARDALRGLAAVGSTLRVELDVQKRDRYGRLLGYLWRDDLLLNEEMARRGYAVALTYPPNVRYVERIRRAVEEARGARRGLWKTEMFSCAPRDFRANRCR